MTVQGPPPFFRIDQAQRTHPGAVRRVNEDVAVARPDAGLWAVADGMGGHAGGGWASGVIAEVLEHAVLPGGIAEAAAAVETALEGANATIWAAARTRGAPIGSTVAALLIRNDRFAILWAGDSRVYRHRGGSLDQLTTDHSEVEGMVARGLIDRREADTHPLRNVLARSVGTAPILALDRSDGRISEGDVFLLCSDGLSGTIGHDEIAAVLTAAAPERAAQTLMDRALARGAPDNVTVTIIGCEQTTMFGAMPARH